MTTNIDALIHNADWPKHRPAGSPVPPEAKHGDKGEPGYELLHPKSIAFEGEGWTEAGRTDAAAGIAEMQAVFPNAPPLVAVAVADHVQWGGKSNDRIYLNEIAMDDERNAQHIKEMGPFLHGEGRRWTVVHEYGHVMDGDLLRNHPEAYDKLNAHFEEPLLFAPTGKMLPRIRHGLEAPSPYGSENRYEWTAEALTDYVRNGAAARPTSKVIGRIFTEVYG